MIPTPISLPKKLGPRLVKTMPLEIIFLCLDKNELFRLSWGAKNCHGEQWEKLEREFQTRLERMQNEALKEGWLKPQAVFGYWPCQSDGNDLIIYDPASLSSFFSLPKGKEKRKREITRFTFPRQTGSDALCLADYFASIDSGKLDVVAFQVVTVGHQATNRFEKLEASSEYSEMYFMHGLAVQTAEATAEYLHRHIRKELGLAEGQGKRYSWGYPVMPALADHRKVFDLLPAEKELDMTLTSAFQLVPEQSTASMIVHHKDAKYFNIHERRIEQLTKP